MSVVDDTIEDVLWVAHTLFEKGLVTGTTGNISFLNDGKIYISKSGSCFGRLDKDSFAILDLEGVILEGQPSKEYPLHVSIYKKQKETHAVLHTHSLYATAVSCKKDLKTAISSLCTYTPYLHMLIKGKISWVDYAKPGSMDLFEKFDHIVEKDVDVYLLRNHGLLISSSNILSAFSILEEFEVSAKLQMLLRSYHDEELQQISYRNEDNSKEERS